MVTDDELNGRLKEVAGFVPADQWNHVRHCLRQGHLYYVRRHDTKVSTGKDDLRVIYLATSKPRRS